MTIRRAEAAAVSESVAPPMSYREYLPHPALGPTVDRFWTQSPRSAAGGGDPAGGKDRRGPDQSLEPRRILPDGCIDLLVNLTSGRAVVVGTMTRALVIPPGAGSAIVAVRFRPGGAVPFLRVPAHQLTDADVPCADLGATSLVPAGLAPATAPDQAVAALQTALLDRLREAGPPDPLVDHAARLLLTGAGTSIEQVARRLGWSRQHLRRAFRTHVGVGPKHFDRVARLQRTVADLQGQPARSLADLAAGCGYFDQAHMTGDFRALVGLTPRQVRGSGGSIFPIRSLLAGP
jgi:AraC-like DNA-binding protein